MSLHRFVIGAVSAFSLLLAVIPGARAQETLRAAAVVNDEVVSVLDVKMRLRLTVMSSGLKDTPELRQRVMRRVLRNLIDERLQAQEAKRLDIAVTDKEVDDALGQLARRNKMPLKRFLSYLQQRGVLVEAMRDQVRAQLTWQALVARRLRPSVQITDEEVNEVAEQVRADSGSMLWQISEIVLTSDGQTTDAEVRRNAERLLRQLRTGAKFGALARQFSESATAPRGGDVGWVNAAQLPEEIAAVLAAMKPGTVSGPIRTLDGYHIVLLRKQRQSTAGEVILDLNQVFFPIPKGADAAARNQAMAAAAEARGKLNGCQDIDATARALGAPGSGNLGTVKLSELPGAAREAVARLPIGQPSEPVVTPNGVNVLVVCARKEKGIDRARIKRQLTDERLSMASRRYMRDLRRNANVDVRI